MSSEINSINIVAAKLRQHFENGVAAYESFEIGSKKSLLMASPATNEVFYIDKFGRPLQEHESQALAAEFAKLSANIKIVDISREESKKNLLSNTGFHANQTIYADSEWQPQAEQKIREYAQANVAREVVTNTERFQQPAKPGFFSRFTRAVGKENAQPVQEANKSTISNKIK